MSGLIKQQILKRLSKFTKNLSADQISLSAMKGEGDLTNLDLDEAVLMELLGAPSWMKLTRAFCNKLTIKVQWTKLSSQPIVLILDEVNIDMETCDYRSQSSDNIFSSHSPGKYGYTEQIMDGMSVSINVININFKSSSFHATFQMSRVTVESRTPTWQPGRLDWTRIKNDLRGEVIIYKEVQWQAVRVEANALTDWILTTPLRLIANQSKIRITLKKRMSDCLVLCSKVEVYMDDVLWVLTDSQVFAAMTFLDDLRNIVTNSQSQSSSQSKPLLLTLAAKSPSAPHRALTQRQLDVERFFDKFNESSYHFYTGRVELHLCDDTSQESSSYRCRVEGGAMQLVLNQLEFSFYPMRCAGASRQGWPRYNDCNVAVERWTNGLLSSRYLRHADVVDWHLRDFSKDVKREALESCFVVRLRDLCLYCVSSSTDGKKAKPRRFFGSDKKRLMLPDDMPVLHLEYSDYLGSPIPSSIHVVVNPVCLSVHHASLLWVNAFLLNVVKKSENLPQRTPSTKQVDTKIEILMPRITLPACETHECRRDEDMLQISTSKLLVTNVLSDDSSHKNSTPVLAKQFNACRASKFCMSGVDFAGCRCEESEETSHRMIHRQLEFPRGFVDVITKSDKILKKEGDDEMWCVVCDQFWIDFLTPNKQTGAPSSSSATRKFKTQNFVEAFPFTLWILVSPAKEAKLVELDTKPPASTKYEQSVTCLTFIDEKIKAVCDCQQLNFLTRVLGTTSKTSDEMALDAYRIGLSVPSVEVSTTVLTLLPRVEVSFVLPSSPLASSVSSSSSFPCVSLSSSSLSLCHRPTERNGPKPDDDDSPRSVEPSRNGEWKASSSDNLLLGDGDEAKTNRSSVEDHLDHFLELSSSSFESVRKQTRETVTSVFSEISTKFRGSDSHVHENFDEDEWISMVHEQAEIPAFERPNRCYDDNDCEDVISESSSNKKKVVSVLMIGLQSVDVLLRMNTMKLESMLTIENISSEEIDKINFEKFKANYILGNNNGSSSMRMYPNGLSDHSFLKLRYEVSRLPHVTEFRDSIDLDVRDCDLNAKLSTVMKIAKAFEGPEGTPLESEGAPDMLVNVCVGSVFFNIQDKACNHRVKIKGLNISKGDDGVFVIDGGSSVICDDDRAGECKSLCKDKEESKLEHENKMLKEQLEKLGRLTTLDGFNEDPGNKWRDRCRGLEAELATAEAKLTQLSAERDSLLKLVDTLQGDLEFSEKMRNKTSHH